MLAVWLSILACSMLCLLGLIHFFSGLHDDGRCAWFWYVYQPLLVMVLVALKQVYLLWWF